jgi:hypothetical protein
VIQKLLELGPRAFLFALAPFPRLLHRGPIQKPMVNPTVDAEIMTHHFGGDD